jgi:DNA-binding cell septation regulator SpoVG
MKITAEARQAGRFTFYTIRLHTDKGDLEIKDCKLIEGSKGRFVGFPARKDDKDKWWPYLYASEAFQVEIIKAMDAATPKQDTRTLGERKKPTLAEMDDDIPF